MDTCNIATCVVENINFKFVAALPYYQYNLLGYSIQNKRDWFPSNKLPFASDPRINGLMCLQPSAVVACERGIVLQIMKT